MPTQKLPPSRKPRSRLRPPDADAATMRLLAARARQAAAHENGRAPQPEEAPAPEPAEAPAAQPAEPLSAEPASPGLSTDPGLSADPTPSTARPFLLPVILAVVTLVLGGLAAWFGAEANSLNTPASQNAALTNPSATSTLSRQISSAINALFSYDYAFPDPTSQAARRLLTGPAVGQYATLFGQVQREAPRQKLIVTTTVTNVGVEILDGTHARVLVFAIESDKHAAAAQPTSAGAMLAVNAVLQNTTWKIEGIDTFSST
jgi:Mce-associated membrane protein